jgi:hypothetical protein
VDRRCLLISGIAIAALPPLAQTQTPASLDFEVLTPLPPLPGDLAQFADQSPAPYVETAVVGRGKPEPIEIDMAYEMLLETPYDTQPIHVAEHLLAVGTGAYGQTLRPFAREWPVRANPAIFHFFSATGDAQPRGDLTPWCAAFLNWCLLRARAKARDEIGRAPGSYSRSGRSFSDANIQRYSTGSASSGSFRCWEPSPTKTKGQIAVFKDAGTEGSTASCRGTGHVAFYLSSPRADRILVLGGNQVAPGSGGAITVASMSTAYGSRYMDVVKLKG